MAQIIISFRKRSQPFAFLSNSTNTFFFFLLWLVSRSVLLQKSTHQASVTDTVNRAAKITYLARAVRDWASNMKYCYSAVSDTLQGTTFFFTSFVHCSKSPACITPFRCVKCIWSNPGPSKP